MLRAFCAWKDGRALIDCRALVNHNRRLLHNALRVMGWSHALGNLMNSLVTKDKLWDRFNPGIRSICEVLRNSTWRKNIKRRLPPGVPHPERLDHFSANLADWRYETVDFVLGSITNIRDILANHVRMEIFASPQDRITISSAVDACTTPELLSYCAVAYNKVIHDTEQMRHWGLVCGCAEHRRMRHEGHKHLQCFFNGKRLGEVWPFVCDKIAEVKQVARTLTPEDCEGPNAVLESISGMLARKVSGLNLRFAYYGLVPWLFARADEKEGAVECLKQVRSRALEDHDEFTVDIMRRFGGDIDRVAEDGECSDRWAEEVSNIRLLILDESAGEGYHRGTSREKGRAPASATEHLVQNNRRQQELRRIRRFIELGAEGVRIVRYEWRQWKRLLQTTWKARWSNTRDTRESALAQIYHTDDASREDWSLIVKREEPARPVVTEAPSTRVHLEHEYLASTMRAGQYYHVPKPEDHLNEAGTLVRTETPFFPGGEHSWIPFATVFNAHVPVCRQPGLMGIDGGRGSAVG